jgi:preprotein translocase subunit SecB
MQISPLQLKQYFLTKVMVDQRDKTVSPPTFGPIDLEKVNFNVNLEHGFAADEEKDPRHFLLRLSMVLDEKREATIPYDISLELIGFFEVAENIAKDKRAGLVVANGAAILYTAAREIIVSLTGRFSRGSIMVPGVNFVDDANKLESQQDLSPANARTLDKSVDMGVQHGQT